MTKYFLHPARFLVPTIFLVVLGVGNIFVGTFKFEQYQQVVHELEEIRPALDLLETSPMKRIHLAEQAETNLFKQRERAKARLDLYGMVIFTGQLFLGLSGIVLIVGGLFSMLKARSVSAQQPPTPSPAPSY